MSKKFTINHAMYEKPMGNNDECYTPRYVVESILPFIPQDKIIWCPFDKEDSFFVQVLRENNFKVVHSHIDEGKNFFLYEPEEWDIIISNPPFTNKRAFFERAFELGKPFMLLMTAQWLNDSTPVKLYMQYDRDMELIHFEKRIKFLNTDQKGIPFKTLFYCSNILPKNNVLLNI